MTQETTSSTKFGIYGGHCIEEEIIRKLQSKDKDDILDIPTLLMDERVDLNRLVETAIGCGALSGILALIEIADCMERKPEFEAMMAEHEGVNGGADGAGVVIEEAIFPYSEFRRHIKRSFLEDIEKRWNVRIAFTLDDFYKIYRDYHLLPYHGDELKRYFGDQIEV